MLVEKVIGNINDGLFTTEAQKNIQKELDSLTVVSQSAQECLDCSICSGCSWCTAYNYQRYGTLNKRATFICPIQIASALGALYFHKFNNPNYNKINVDKEKALRIINEVEWNLLMEGGKQNGV